MSTAQVAAPAAASPHGRPWWRGRFGLVVAIAIAMFVAFLGWKNQLSWPINLNHSATESAVPPKIDTVSA